jgi:hypothetical protein
MEQHRPPQQCPPRRGVGSYRVGLLVVALCAAVLVPTAAWSDTLAARPDVVGDWFQQTVATAELPPASSPLAAQRAWAIAWLAAQRAVDADDGRRVPSAQRPRFEDAAVATAVHDALVAYAPDRKSTLDAALVASLAAIPNSAAKAAGQRAGHQAAARTLHEREGDGLDQASVDEPYTAPPEAPGVYRLPPGATFTTGAGFSKARPFWLDRADQFRPGAPPALGTDTYRRDLLEVQRLGSATSTERTQLQTEIAWLWAQSSLRAYIPALRPLVQDSGRPLRWKVRLLAAFTTTTIDSLIAVGDAKFKYLLWRPVTAIRAADTDGDPLTVADPDWTSLVPTPAGPEYPSGHAGFAGAAEQVLERFAGPVSPASFTVTVTLDPPFGSGQVISREFRRGTPWSALTQDTVDARVWAGLHYRFSDEVGADLGRRVAEYGLQRLGSPNAQIAGTWRGRSWLSSRSAG